MALTPFDMEGVNRDLLAAGNPAKPDMQSILRRNARDLVLGNAILVSSADARELTSPTAWATNIRACTSRDTTGIKGGDFEHFRRVRGQSPRLHARPDEGQGMDAISSDQEIGAFLNTFDRLAAMPEPSPAAQEKTIFLPAYTIRPAR